MIPDAEGTSLAEEVEAALDASGFTWKRRESGWVVPACGGLPREIAVVLAPETVEGRAILVEWDEIGPTEKAALVRFLDRAQRGLRNVRWELDERQARLVSQVDTEDVERGLGDALGGIAAGVRLLNREAGALLVPEVARVLLDFFEDPGERIAPATL